MMRERLEILDVIRVFDGLEHGRGYETAHSVHADRTDMTNAERFALGVQGARRSARFTIRKYPLTPEHRLRHRGVVYRIEAVREMPRHRLEITAVEA